MNVEATILGRDLVELRDALARASTDPWAEILFVSRGVRRIQPDEAEAELARVHATEAGRLLREAAMLRAFLDTPRETHTRRERLRAALAGWRRRARAELALWRVDGFEGPALLRACVARPFARWDTPRALAQAALAIDPCDAGRLCSARAELVAGASVSATIALEVLLDREPESELRRAAVRALALADRCVEASRSSGRGDVTER